MESDVSFEDVLRVYVKFNEVWCKFVDVYESYLELLDSFMDVFVLEKV